MATSPLFEELERVMRAPMVADNLPCSAQCVLSGSQMRTHRTNSVDRARISIDIMGVDDVLMMQWPVGCGGNTACRMTQPQHPCAIMTTPPL
jgi:hypothetical protein